ncbi:hypothetical protein [Actinophytocola oryzae]|uniref:Uncharacterized protein n=1 Tax=Actinophytocola oryzae TaxID=502181 RepID=A0A4R7W300_9PSEU|nr:hypothetical protein [Actinophytocola oryzae]TDV55967.1 hypothetical protein CLV71_10228 [Actinophytocola oryzae]
MAVSVGVTLLSTVDETAVVVVRWSADAAALTCGGVPMVAKADYLGPSGARVEAGHASGTLLGKRYATPDGAVELLCVKPGQGSLALDGVPLETKTAKPLPASD